MFHSHVVWITSVAVAILSLGLGNAKAKAQTQYPFEAIYNSETILEPITANILKITNIGESANAPYGLTRLVNISYGNLNSNTGVITIDPDPTTFGLENFGLGNITIFGQGEDRLFGTTRGTATLDFQNLVGTVSNTINITGGNGRFSGAIGTLILSENLTLNPDPTAPVRGRPLIKGSFQTFQTVPEPRNIAAIFSIGAIGVGFLLRQRQVGVAD
ncbi:MAG: hypothetical protein KME22_16180 [Hassallia sp. WJT32-NPBG1]|jgi:hypothetical protein|nr:hypothetical protein [Hassallia sp. WJT32-NPBG1]